ncbi:DUF92 domain-containing protein [Chitinophaga ginsengisegetis]|uniref:DUF92 domain-containing protein n=1 Tax=Chitinophaga ginsengisegetis TaxID=393003 RepID=UPI000DB980EC|nr:DUF92 domain-containing protein [Chitinophaga ginsengisegetis]MDR6567482.1 uncharacterized protein (TIGR00297 family) [Chitinophaga ginsengisegetis]MDR6647213.1 uncharacterized protein (TIGR00297 family) [Chitinophaga ginsengisegetis]MDR6653562.1 uncharacterized protein (TIGR00297 family) [Chitinophaga ginsengisegetis]
MQLSSFFELIIILVAIIAIAVLCVKKRKLTPGGGVMAAAVALLVAAGTGYGGLLLLGAFFIMGITATSHKKHLKIFPGENHPEQRTAGQVFANGGVAAIMALLALISPDIDDMYQMMLAASLAAATADTLSSELGMVYGRNFYNILTFKKEARGLDGVVSLEGTLLGAAGAGILALLYGICFGMDETVWFVAIAGIAGNLADSLLGATLERKHIIGNDTVNFGNTLLGAITAMLLYLL